MEGYTTADAPHSTMVATYSTMVATYSLTMVARREPAGFGAVYLTRLADARRCVHTMLSSTRATQVVNVQVQVLREGKLVTTNRLRASPVPELVCNVHALSCC